MSERIERGLREIVADPEPDPEIRAEILSAIGSEAQYAPGPGRRLLLVAPAAAAVLLLAVFLATQPEDPEPEVTVCFFGEAEPITSVFSEDGRFRLDLTRLETAPADGDLRRAELSFSAQLLRADRDLYLAHGDPVSKVVTPDGTDRTPASHSLFHFGPVAGALGAWGIDLGPAPDALSLFELSVTLLRLRSEPVEIVVPAGKPGSRIVAPFELTFGPEPETFSLGMGMTDRSLGGYPEGRPPAFPARSAFGYGEIRITDAEGRELMSGAGSSSGGWEVRFFHLPAPGNDPFATAPIAYPVTIRIRDPQPVESIPAVFRFTNLSLPPLAPGPRSEWGEESGGLRMRVRRPASLEQGERMAVAVEIEHDPARLPEGAERFLTMEAPAFLALRLTPAGGGEEIVLRPDLVATPPPPPLDDDLSVASPLDGTPVPIQEAEFPLARLRDELPPGRYTARVEYVFPGPEERWPFTKEDRAVPGFWRGTVTSAVFPLEIRPETPHQRVLVLPKDLEVAAGEQGPEIRFPTENERLEEVRPVVPNGWYLGMRIYRDDDLISIQWLEPGSVLDSLGDDPGPLDRTIRIEVFRTLEPPGHFWPMNGTEIVLTRTFRVRATAAQIEALRKPR